MQKYVLVKFINPIADGTEFLSSQWPLHVTLVANFTIDRHGIGLDEKLATLLSAQETAETTAGSDERFGPQGSVAVTVLNMTPQLMTLHEKLAKLLREHGAVFDEPRYLNAGYRAHATIQAECRLHAGDHVTIDELTLVDMFPDDDIMRRRTIHTFSFGNL